MTPSPKHQQAAQEIAKAIDEEFFKDWISQEPTDAIKSIQDVTLPILAKHFPASDAEENAQIKARVGELESTIYKIIHPYIDP